MLNDLKHTVRNLSEVTNEQRGRVTIATFSSFAINPLVFLVRRYRETRPLIEIRIREGRQSEIVEDVRSGAADFGIGYINSLPEMMESILLRKEPMLVLVPNSHPVAAKKRPRIRLAELRDEPLVSAPSDTFIRRTTDAAAVSAGFNLHYTVMVDRLISIIHHVCAGVGIAILPSGCLPDRQWGEGFHAAQLAEPSLSVSVGLITARGRYLTPAASGMVSLIREQVAKQVKTSA
jgi:DNA-binding transcriptional LysR family regulator